VDEANRVQRQEDVMDTTNLNPAQQLLAQRYH